MITFERIRAERVALAARFPPRELEAGELARIFSRLPPHLPISDQYESDLPQKTGRWWHSQREHMQSWFAMQAATPARVTYNRMQCTAAFIWIGEALGEDPAIVQAVADAARAEPMARRRPGVVRDFLPWDSIEALATLYR